MKTGQHHSTRIAFAAAGFVFSAIIVCSSFILCSRGANGTIKKELCFTVDNRNVYLFKLFSPGGMVAEISNLGGVIFRLYVPDRQGHLGNVVLGFESLNDYLNNVPHFGALIGRYANRIANARFTLDGTTYHLTANSHGTNTIHGGKVGFDKNVWDARDTATSDGLQLTLTHLSPDGHEGFPGNLWVSVTYTLTNDNALRIDYTATTDKPTVINFTNHCYFNLAGEGNGDVLNHYIMIDADSVTPVDTAGIPTGALEAVAGTPYDFRNPRLIGSEVSRLPHGYDINYVLNHPVGVQGLSAKVWEETRGRVLELFTTEPGLQFYTASGLHGTYSGAGGKRYYGSYGFCLETEHFPDSPNEPNFPSTVLRPGQEFRSTTIFKFTTLTH